MELKDVASLITSIAALITAITGLLWVRAKIRAGDVRMDAQDRRSDRMERVDSATDMRLDGMVAWHLRSAERKAVKDHLIQPISGGGGEPYRIRQDIREAYEPIAKQLQELWRREGAGLPKERIAPLIEAKWGPWLHRHICEVYDLEDLVCWRIAILIAQEGLKGPPITPPRFEPVSA